MPRDSSLSHRAGRVTRISLLQREARPFPAGPRDSVNCGRRDVNLHAAALRRRINPKTSTGSAPSMRAMLAGSGIAALNVCTVPPNLS